MSPSRPLSSVRLPVWLVVALLLLGVAGSSALAVAVANRIESKNRDVAISRAECREDAEDRADLRGVLSDLRDNATEPGSEGRAIVDGLLRARPPKMCRRNRDGLYVTIEKGP